MTYDSSQSAVLSRYQTYLLPVYADICGDVDSYFGVGPDFERFLGTNRGYESISAQTAVPDDAAAALRTYLQGGQNCHETSFVKQRENETGLLAQSLVEGTRTAVYGPQLYAFWQVFRNSYFDQLQHIAGLANRGFFLHAVQGDMRWKLNTGLLQRVARTSVVTEMFAEKVLAEVMGKVADRAPEAPEYALVRSQLSQVRNLRKLAAALHFSVSNLEAPETGALMTNAAKFNETLTVMTHPILWSHFVFTDASQYKGALHPEFKVAIDVPKNVTSTAGSNSAPIMDLMDLVFIFAAKNGIPLLILLTESQDALIITSAKSLKGARKNPTIADLAKRLGATWRTPGWFSRSHAHSISIPLETTGSSGESGTPASGTGGGGTGRVASFSLSPEDGAPSRSPMDTTLRPWTQTPQRFVPGLSLSTNTYLNALFSPGAAVFAPLLRVPVYAK